MRAVEIAGRAIADCHYWSFFCDGESRWVTIEGEQRPLCPVHQVEAVAGRLAFVCKMDECDMDPVDGSYCADCARLVAENYMEAI